MNNYIPVVDRCMIASEKPPQEWPIEILDPLPQDTSMSIFGDAQIQLARNRTMSLLDALVMTYLCKSNNEARTAIRNNAVMINRVKTKDVARVLTASDELPNIEAIVVECGKYNIGIVEMMHPL